MENMLLSPIEEVNDFMITEELIEAVSYASESGEEWWEAFDNHEVALEVINGAIKEIPEEYHIVMLLDSLDSDGEWFSKCRPEQEYERCLQKLKKQLLKEMER